MIPDYSMPILVVDDTATMVRIMTGLLGRIGYSSVDSASSGPEALDKIKHKQFGLVISDWNMEPMSGLELLCRVRRDQKMASVPFIMVTAESKTENVIAAKKAGVNNYIVKPFNAEALKSKIDAVFAV